MLRYNIRRFRNHRHHNLLSYGLGNARYDDVSNRFAALSLPLLLLLFSACGCCDGAVEEDIVVKDARVSECRTETANKKTTKLTD